MFGVPKRGQGLHRSFPQSIGTYLKSESVVRVGDAHRPDSEDADPAEGDHSWRKESFLARDRDVRQARTCIAAVFR